MRLSSRQALLQLQQRLFVKLIAFVTGIAVLFSVPSDLTVNKILIGSGFLLYSGLFPLKPRSFDDD